MLSDLSDAILATLADTPGVGTCELFAGQVGDDGQVGKSVRTPALLLRLARLDPGQDPGTGQVGVSAHFSLYVIARNARGAEARGRDITALVEHLLPRMRLTRWGVAGVGCAEIGRAMPHYLMESKGFGLWEIEFTHWLALGESVWDGEPWIPDEVWVGLEPLLGPAHVDEYERVHP